MTRPVRILALLSDPLVDGAGQPVPRLGLDREVARVRAQLSSVNRAAELHLVVATPDNLLNALRNGPYDMLHFSGHGGDGTLAFEDNCGGLWPTDPARLRATLTAGGQTPCQVAFLSACHSASMAAALQAAGVPHVVAVDAAQSILDPAARAFAAHFLPYLLAGHSVRQAFDAGCAAALNDTDTRRALEALAEAQARNDPQIAALVVALRAKRQSLADLLQRMEVLKFRLLPEPADGAPDPHAAIPFPDVPAGTLAEHLLPGPPAALGVTPECFTGRARDLHQVLTNVLDHRLTTIRGGGGMGKSELAREAGRWCARRGRFPGGIFFVELGRLGKSPTVADARLAIAAAALGANLAPAADDRALAAALPPDSLLILDELDRLCYDHLRATRALLEALAGAGRAHVLVTSRQVSGASGEFCYELHRLLPPTDGRLFVELARARIGELHAGDDELVAVLQFLDGVPRAIHLAAKQLNTPDLTVLLNDLQQAQETILHDPDIPAAERTDHESVLVTLESSFRRLLERDPEAAAFFPRLALFPAGIGAAGLEAVFGAGAARLARTVHDLSLADVEPPLDYYYLPAPVRSYAERRLAPERLHIMSTCGAKALTHYAKFSDELGGLITGGGWKRASPSPGANYQTCACGWTGASMPRPQRATAPAGRRASWPRWANSTCLWTRCVRRRASATAVRTTLRCAWLIAAARPTPARAWATSPCAPTT
jgi:hypothetical protein